MTGETQRIHNRRKRMIQFCFIALMLAIPAYPVVIFASPDCTQAGISISVAVTFENYTYAYQAYEGQKIVYSVNNIILGTNDCWVSEISAAITLPNGQRRTVGTDLNVGGVYGLSVTPPGTATYTVNRRDVIEVAGFRIVRATATVTGTRHLPAVAGVEYTGPVTATVTIDTLVLKPVQRQVRCYCNINIPKNWQIPGWLCGYPGS